MNPIRKKRIYSILFVFLFSVSGISLILYSLNSNLDYFFTPTELKNKTIPVDKRIKVGGMVLKGSVERISSKVSFTTQQGKLLGSNFCSPFLIITDLTPFFRTSGR